MRTCQTIHDFTSRSYIKNSTHVNSDQRIHMDTKYHLYCFRRGSIGQKTNLYHAKREIHILLNIPKMTHMRTNRRLYQMGSPAKFQDNGRAPSWTLNGHGNERMNQRRISMMMAELPLGLFMILGWKAVPLSHLVQKNQRAADLMSPPPPPPQTSANQQTPLRPIRRRACKSLPRKHTFHH